MGLPKSVSIGGRWGLRGLLKRQERCTLREAHPVCRMLVSREEKAWGFRNFPGIDRDFQMLQKNSKPRVLT